MTLNDIKIRVESEDEQKGIYTYDGALKFIGL
jgi:hypothetical protein